VWCRCKKAPIGFTNKDTGDLWVCSRCGKPTRQVFEGLTAMLGPNDATCLLSVSGKSNGIFEIRWATKSGVKITLEYHPYPRKVDMHNGRELLLHQWQMLDSAVNNIHTTKDPDDLMYQKARARTLCEVIHSFMPQFYESADHVAREALSRFSCRAEGVEHETPGLGEKYWDPNTRADGTPYSQPQKPKPRSTGNLVPATALVSVKKGIEGGMFTVDQIATMYSMTAPEVKEQLGLA
jgi:hypothetical protein